MKATKEFSHRHKMSNKPIEGDPRSVLQQLCHKEVVGLKSDATVLEAAELMLRNQIGNIVILDEEGGKSIPVGIVTDRDIVIKTVAKGAHPETVKVSEIMTKNVITASETDDLMGIIGLMTAKGVSRVPFVDEAGAVIGILTSKKIYQYLARGLCELSSISDQQHQREAKRH